MLRTEKKRRQTNGQFINEGFVKSGETTFSVLSTGSDVNSVDMTKMKNPELKKERFSKDNIAKSLDDIYTRSKNSKLGSHIMNNYLHSSSHELREGRNKGKKNRVTLSSFTIHGDEQD